MKIRLLLLLAVPIYASVACGKSDAEKFGDAYCTEIVKCCGQQGLPTDGQLCRLMMGAGQGYDATAGEACLAEMRAQVAAGTFCQGGASDPSSPCKSVYAGSTGNKKPGETCNTDEDCAKSTEGTVACASAYVDGTFVDKCQVRVAGKVGDACIGTQNGAAFFGNGDDIPPRGTVCNIADGLRCSSGSCVALKEVGGPCAYSDDCVPSAYCDSSQDKCATRVATGGTCAGGVSGDECAAGSYCDSTTKRCTVQLANGSACSDSNMCLSGDCTGSVCADPVLGFVCGSSSIAGFSAR